MINFVNVSKYYAQGQKALKDVSLQVNDGEFIFLHGHSGAGKSTLLKIIAGIESPTLGKVLINDVDISQMSHSEIISHRRSVGIVFQDHRLLMNRTVAENVALPLLIKGVKIGIDKLVLEALKKVDLDGKEDLLPIYLSYGEQQRVGIARAIVSSPSVILADEPTGNLDNKLSAEVFDLFTSLNKLGISIILATHNEQLATDYQYKKLYLENGEIK